MTNKNPAALRLAEDIATDAALEIRRLHEKNERLLAANNDSTNHFDALMADHKKLQEVYQELLEAFEDALPILESVLRINGDPASDSIGGRARAAIAKAEGETK